MRSDIEADYCAIRAHTGNVSSFRMLLTFLKYVSFRAAVLYRVGNRLRRSGHRFLGGVFERLLHLLCGVDLSTTAEIGGGLRLVHASAGTVIGNKVRIGRNATVLQGVTIGGNIHKSRPDGWTQPVIGDDVLIGAGAKVLGPITIGNRVTIGANSVVVTDLPDDAVAVGVPARTVRIGRRRVDLQDRGGELARVLTEMRREMDALTGRLDRLERRDST